jgi:hypothetical protein
MESTHERKTWREESLSDQVKALAEKIRTAGIDALTSEERGLMINIDETAFLASLLAKRSIAPRYIRLLRTSGRLTPAKKAGNTYLYTVGAIAQVRFNERTPQ